MPFRVIEFATGSVVIEVGDTLDFRTAASFKYLVQDQLDSGIRNFILDFRDTDKLDSTGLGSIFLLYRKLSSLGGQVIFADVSRTVTAAVQMTHVHRVFQQFSTVRAARKAVKKLVAGEAQDCNNTSDSSADTSASAAA